MKARYLVVLGSTLLFLFGCATTGDIPVDIGQPEAIYISPANQDGVQDEVALPLSVVPLEKTVLKSYSVTVRDAQGEIVRSFSESVPGGGFSRQARRRTVTPPEIALWSGDNDSGEYVADGEYTLVVSVADNRDNVGRGPEQLIVVDNTPPNAEVSVSFPLFTPNGDGRLDTLPVFQRGSTWEAAWEGQFVSASGSVARSYRWEGLAKDFAWDGTVEGGGPALEGQYGYRLAATDLAGNSAVFEIGDLALEREARQLTLGVSSSVFSPNSDGKLDDITLTPGVPITANLASWVIEIADRTGKAMRRYEGQGVPTDVRFDGKSGAGATLPDGTYRAVMKVAYRGGQEPETASPLFRLDTQPPRGSVTADFLVFSPDGDGRKDVINLFQDTSIESEWRGAVVDAAGRAVRSWTWKGTAANFSWDGRDATGTKVPDGSYRYLLTSTDDAANTGSVQIADVRIDTRLTPVTLTAAAARFSPNGDGVQDALPLDLGLAIADGIESWEVTIVGAGGSSLGVVAGGGARMPPRVQWDGKIDGKALADGSYSPALKVTYVKGNVSTARSAPTVIDNTPPTVSVRVAPRPFSPDGDGVDENLTITLGVTDVSPIEGWRATILDPAGNLFIEFSGRGVPTAPIVWNGRSPSGELVQSAEDYRVVATATDAVWNVGRQEEIAPIDILVIRDGDRLLINITAIHFAPNTADYRVKVEPDRAARNRQTLDRLAEVLKKYAQYQISVEGHAVMVYWDVPARAEVEQAQVLLPLSGARAAVVKAALVERGIEDARMTTRGFGGLRPVVPHGDTVNRWKSRRVEFILVRK